MAWTEKTKQSETWTERTRSAEGWTEKTQQSEAWSEVARLAGGTGFAPGFAARPAFAVASPAGVYTDKTEQAETWTPAP